MGKNKEEISGFSVETEREKYSICIFTAVYYRHTGNYQLFYDRGIPAGYEPFGKAQQPKAGGSAECIYDTVCAQDDPDVRYAVL